MGLLQRMMGYWWGAKGGVKPERLMSEVRGSQPALLSMRLRTRRQTKVPRLLI